MLSQDWSIHFRSDGLALSPAEYARLLARLAEDEGIAADEFSLGGAVERLEQRMAALLGKETAIFMPSGTLANHLAVRLLAQRGRRVLVQRESHIYRDTGDCAQELSGLTLVPLAAGRTSFTLDEVIAEAAREEDGRVRTPIGAISIERPVRRWRARFSTMPRCGGSPALPASAGSGCISTARGCFSRPLIPGSRPRLRGAVRYGLRVALQIFQRRRRGGAGRAAASARRALSSAPHVRRRAAAGLALRGGGVALSRRLRRALRRGGGDGGRLFGALGEHPRVQVLRSAASTNVTRLRIRGAAAASLPERLAARGISIRPALAASTEPPSSS